MAAPHVVGAAALIWRACNSCTNTQVAQCLEDTAMDLGTTGRDDQFGHGLVRTENAYLCLINDIGCCSAAQQRSNDEDTSNPSSALITMPPTGSPTTPPTISPSMTPTGSPTTPPTISPSASFAQTLKQFAPTGKPTNTPTVAPNTDAPSTVPTTSHQPTTQSTPTGKPTNTPSVAPTTDAPSAAPTDKPTNTPTVRPTTAPSSQPLTFIETIMARKQCTPEGGQCSADSECCQYSRCSGLSSWRRCRSFLFSFPSPP